DAAVDGRREAERAAVSAASLAATLRGAMHLAFVVLLSVGTVRAHDVDGAPLPLTLLAAAAIAVIYGLGSRFALRRAGSGEAEWTDLLLPSRGWVLLLTLAWMAGTIVSTAFVWIAFPLFFLVLFSLGRVAGPLALAGVALWAVLAPLVAREQGRRGTGEVLAPLVGRVSSPTPHAAHGRLRAETARSRQLVGKLQAPTGELAAPGRRRGIAEDRQRLAKDTHDTPARGLNS